MNNNLINNNNSNMFKVIWSDRGSSISSWMGGGLSMEGHKQITIHEIFIIFFSSSNFNSNSSTIKNEYSFNKNTPFKTNT